MTTVPLTAVLPNRQVFLPDPVHCAVSVLRNPVAQNIQTSIWSFARDVMNSQKHKALFTKLSPPLDTTPVNISSIVKTQR